MVQKTLSIENPMGLHARAAAKLVSITSRFQSRITLCRLGHKEEIDGKSILGILFMNASRGTLIIFTFDGPDEEEACATIESLFFEHFGERKAAK